MSDKLVCPRCGGNGWLAIEQYTSQSLCYLSREDDGSIEIDVDSESEFHRKNSSSIILAYMCDSELCNFSFEAHSIEDIF